jgi:hypothetical protein
VTVNGATLGGTGQINGATELQSGAILSAAHVGTIGTLQLNTLLLKDGSTVVADLLNAANYDQILLNNISRDLAATDTTLDVVDLLDGTVPFQVNDTFQIFSTGVGDTFTHINMPQGYQWDMTKLATEGKVSVLTVSVPEPRPFVLGLVGMIPAALWMCKARRGRKAAPATVA